MPTIVTVTGTSRPNNYTAHAMAVVNQALQAAVRAADGLVLGTPEYHGSFCAMTKLIIENLGFPSELKGKPVGLVGVAAGRIGAIKSLEQLRGVCAHTGAIVLPGAISVAGVQQAFDGSGTCTDRGTQGALEGMSAAMLTFIKDYVCPKHVLEDMVRNDGGGAWATPV